MKIRNVQGQGIVETVFLLPLLLLIMLGTYRCVRAYLLLSAADGAAHAQAIRSGRQLAGMESRISDSIVPEGKGVRVNSESGKKAVLLPAPFPALAGRTRGFAEISEHTEVQEGTTSLPPLLVRNKSEMSVDCWEKTSGSGRRIRRIVSGFVATGILR